MKQLFDKSSLDCSKRITKNYSTSFSLAIKMLSPKIQDDIYAIYGFVRCADEIVDTFDDYNQEELLSEFEADFQKAFDRKISLNPVLNAFQEVVHRFDMMDLVSPFLKSMRMDLHKKEYLTVYYQPRRNNIKIKLYSVLTTNPKGYTKILDSILTTNPNGY